LLLHLPLFYRFVFCCWMPALLPAACLGWISLPAALPACLLHCLGSLLLLHSCLPAIVFSCYSLHLDFLLGSVLGLVFLHCCCLRFCSGLPLRSSFACLHLPGFCVRFSLPFLQSYLGGVHLPKHRFCLLGPLGFVRFVSAFSAVLPRGSFLPATSACLTVFSLHLLPRVFCKRGFLRFLRSLPSPLPLLRFGWFSLLDLPLLLPLTVAPGFLHLDFYRSAGHLCRYRFLTCLCSSGYLGLSPAAVSLAGWILTGCRGASCCVTALLDGFPPRFCCTAAD